MRFLTAGLVTWLLTRLGNIFGWSHCYIVVVGIIHCACVHRLNEGFTVFLERKIAAKMFGEKERQFQAIGMFVRACVRACVCVCACVRACVCLCVRVLYGVDAYMQVDGNHYKMQ